MNIVKVYFSWTPCVFHITTMPLQYSCTYMSNSVRCRLNFSLYVNAINIICIFKQKNSTILCFKFKHLRCEQHYPFERKISKLGKVPTLHTFSGIVALECTTFLWIRTQIINVIHKWKSRTSFKIFVNHNSW